MSLGRGLVDPVEVLDHQRHRALARQALEEPPDAQEDLLAHGPAVEVAHALGELSGHLESEQRCEIGKDLGESSPKRGRTCASSLARLRAHVVLPDPARPRSASRKGQ